MSNEINLVTGKTFSLEKRTKQVKILRIVALFSLVIVSLVSLILFLITVTLPISAVKRDQEQTMASLSALHNKHTSYSLITDRINGIKSVNSSRKNYANNLNEIMKILPQSLTVESMNIDTGKLEIGISGSTLLDIDKFIKDLVSLNNKNKTIKNLILENLVLNVQNSKVTLTFQADML